MQRAQGLNPKKEKNEKGYAHREDLRLEGDLIYYRCQNVYQ